MCIISLIDGADCIVYNGLLQLSVLACNFSQPNVLTVYNKIFHDSLHVAVLYLWTFGPTVQSWTYSRVNHVPTVLVTEFVAFLYFAMIQADKFAANL